jgi:hypothetical protein
VHGALKGFWIKLVMLSLKQNARDRAMILMAEFDSSCRLQRMADAARQAI